MYNVTSVSPNCDKYCSKKGKSLLFEKNWQMKWNKKISFIYLSKKRSNFFCHGAIRFAHTGMLSFSPRKDKALFNSVTLSSFVFTQRTHKPTKCSLRNKLYSNSILKGVCFFCLKISTNDNLKLQTKAEKSRYNFTCSSHRISVLLRRRREFVTRKLVRKQTFNIHTALRRFRKIFCFKPIRTLVETIVKLAPFCIPTCWLRLVLSFSSGSFYT